MKTILYQPIFINPQAYFVFPQLYHIEKGDSYIEPANITGQLIINDLTKSLTSTPILNVVQDTNQVDFGLFKGKHIRISQYTNIGAVVLGEKIRLQDKYTKRIYSLQKNYYVQLTVSIIYQQKFLMLGVQVLNGKNLMMNFYINQILELKGLLRKNLFPVKVSIKAFLIFVQISKQRKALETVS